MFRWKPGEPDLEAQDIADLIPRYLNNTLGDPDRKRVDVWLRSSRAMQEEVSSWQIILDAMGDRPVKTLPSEVWKTISGRITDKNHQVLTRLPGWSSQLFGIVFAFAILVILWFGFRPGVTLEWTVSGDPPSLFQVYRADPWSEEFSIVYETASKPGDTIYRFVDIYSLPGVHYSYRVEGLNPGGGLIRSETVSAPTFAALAPQLMILITSAMMGYLALLATQSWKIRQNPVLLSRN